jgi:hypothetical protein
VLAYKKPVGPILLLDICETFTNSKRPYLHAIIILPSSAGIRSVTQNTGTMSQGELAMTKPTLTVNLAKNEAKSKTVKGMGQQGKKVEM